MKKLQILLLGAFLSGFLFASEILVSPLKSKIRKVDTLGSLTYEIYNQSGGQWVLSKKDEVSLGDCEACSRGFSAMFLFNNGKSDDPKYLGYSAISTEITGDSIDRLYVNFILLGKLFRNGKEAQVGSTINESKIPIRINEPLEMIFTSESANPFQTESVGTNADTGPEAHKIRVMIKPKN